MNHKLIHDSIINKAKTRKWLENSHEHHILPVSLGGTDDKENLVCLTGKEHYLIHMLLCFIYPEDDRYISCYRMCYNCNYKYGRERDNISCLRKLVSKVESNKMLGNKYMLGYRHSSKTRIKISNSVSGVNNPFYGKHHSKEYCDKMSKNNPMNSELVKLKSTMSRVVKILNNNPSSIQEYNSYVSKGSVGYKTAIGISDKIINSNDITLLNLYKYNIIKLKELS